MKRVIVSVIVMGIFALGVNAQNQPVKSTTVAPVADSLVAAANEAAAASALAAAADIKAAEKEAKAAAKAAQKEAQAAIKAAQDEAKAAAKQAAKEVKAAEKEIKAAKDEAAKAAAEAKKAQAEAKKAKAEAKQLEQELKSQAQKEAAADNAQQKSQPVQDNAQPAQQNNTQNQQPAQQNNQPAQQQIAVPSQNVPEAVQEEEESDTTAVLRDKGFYIGLQGGALLSLNENWRSYVDHDKASHLITPEASLILGYDITKFWGIRVQANFANNVSAANYDETTNPQFRPYDFKSVSAFLDVVGNLTNAKNEELKDFETKIYLGLGYAYGFGFTDPHHTAGYMPFNSKTGTRYDSWEGLTTAAFGFRGGLIEQYNINENLALYLDLSAECLGDFFNGMYPYNGGDRENWHFWNHALDARLVASFGVSYKF